MSISKSDFFDMLRDYASLEFADLPQNESDINYEFSSRFERKMKRLFNEIDSYSSIKRRRSYKTIIAIAAAVLILLMGLMNVSAIRNPIVNFFTEKYESFVAFFFDGDLSEQIDYEYSFSELPVGFSEIQSEKDDKQIHKVYENINGDLIIFEQHITELTDHTLDNESGKSTTIILSGIEVMIYQSNDEDLWVANWCDNSYFFYLTYYGCTSQAELINVLKLIS